jgi:hypothetical protein
LFWTAGTNLICSCSSKNLLFDRPVSEGAQGIRLLIHSSYSAFSAGEKSVGALELPDLASEAAAPVLFLGVVELEVFAGAGEGAGVGAGAGAGVGAGAVLLEAVELVELVELAGAVVLVEAVVLEEVVAGGASWRWEVSLRVWVHATSRTRRITALTFIFN